MRETPENRRNAKRLMTKFSCLGLSSNKPPSIGDGKQTVKYQNPPVTPRWMPNLYKPDTNQDLPAQNPSQPHPSVAYPPRASGWPVPYTTCLPLVGNIKRKRRNR